MSNVVKFPGNHEPETNSKLTYEDFTEFMETPIKGEIAELYEIAFEDSNGRTKVVGFKSLGKCYKTLYCSVTAALIINENFDGDEEYEYKTLFFKGQNKLDFENNDVMEVAFNQSVPEEFIRAFENGTLEIGWC